MTRTPPRLAALCVLALVAATAVEAAGKLEPPDLERYVRWGPFRVRPGLVVSDVGYDDNIFFRSEDEVSDYTARVSPRVEGLVLFGDTAFVTFTEQVDYTAYLENSDQNYFNQRGQARLVVPLRRMGFFADLALNDVKERPADRQDLRVERNEALVGGGVIFTPGWRTEIEIGIGRGDYRYEDPDFASGGGPSAGELLDRRVTGHHLLVDYRLRGRTSLLFELRRNDLDFDVNDPQDSVEWRATSGIELDRGGPVSGSLVVGWATIDGRSPELPELSEPVGQLELALRPIPRTTIEIEAERRPGFSLAQIDPYFVEASLEGRVVRYINRIFGLESGAAARRVTFPESVSERIDRVFEYDAGMRLRLAETALGRRVEYRVRVGRYRRESDLAFQNQSQTTVTVNAILGY